MAIHHKSLNFIIELLIKQRKIISMNITVKMLVPIPARRLVGNSELTFHQWLPLEVTDVIFITENDVRIKLSFDLDCAPYAKRIMDFSIQGLPVAGIDQMYNIAVNKINIELEFTNFSDELADLIMRLGPGMVSGLDDHLIADHLELTKRIYNLVVAKVNRLIAYFRNEKGHFWLEEYPTTYERLGEFLEIWKTKVKIGSFGWFNWHSFQGSYQIQFTPSVTDRWATKEEWEKVKNFVSSAARPPLVLELLSNAEALAAEKHRRSALIEATSALEVAINEFRRSVKAKGLFSSIMAERMGIENLSKQIEHMGVSGSINFLFPVIFSEEQLSKEILKACQEAIEQRNNVVHAGSRNVDQEKLLHYLVNIRKLCEILNSYQ